jgi:hypothetical protein
MPEGMPVPIVLSTRSSVLHVGVHREIVEEMATMGKPREN